MKFPNFLTKPTSKEVETDVMDVVKRSYPKVVQEIHKEFMTAGDKLLENANKILSELKYPHEEKAKRLNELGFYATPQVVENSIIEGKKRFQKNIAEAVSYFKVKYPDYKFITGEIAKQICEKYKLVLGDTHDYNGFVPDKNIEQIELFYQKHPEDKVEYTRQYYKNEYGSYAIEVMSEIEYKSAVERYESIKKQDPYSANRYGPNHSQGPTVLKICAPIKDMNIEYKKLMGHILMQEIPDPIVMKMVRHDNNTLGYIIITAWGDEASDELVINQNNN